MATLTKAVVQAPAAQVPAKTNVLGSVQGLLMQYAPQIQMAMGTQAMAERMIRVAVTAVSQSPKLQECSPLSICGAVMQAAVLNLEPTSVLGECFLVPFWNKKANNNRGAMEAQLIVGYHGKITLVAHSAELL